MKLVNLRNLAFLSNKKTLVGRAVDAPRVFNFALAGLYTLPINIFPNI